MKTFALLKPEIVSYPALCWQVLEKTLSAGLQVTRVRKVTLSLVEAEKLYDVHKGRFFYERLIRHITSGPVVALELQTAADSTAGDAVERWRKLLGPTKVYRTAYEVPNSLRGAYGLTDTRNVGHGSDSCQSVALESALFFDSIPATDTSPPSKSDLFQLIFGDFYQQPVRNVNIANLALKNFENIAGKYFVQAMQYHLMIHSRETLFQI